MLFVSCPDGVRCRIARYALDGDGAIEVLIDQAAGATAPALSRDGRWLAYVSEESGRSEVYVHPYPDVDAGRWQVSLGGGIALVWSRSDDRLFFVEPASEQLMATVYDPGGSLTFRAPEVFVSLSGYSYSSRDLGRNFDIDLAGERILIGRRAAPATRIVVVLGWFEELERLIPIE